MDIFARIKALEEFARGTLELAESLGLTQKPKGRPKGSKAQRRASTTTEPVSYDGIFPSVPPGASVSAETLPNTDPETGRLGLSLPRSKRTPRNAG
jgi:hypothetical protein